MSQKKKENSLSNHCNLFFYKLNLGKVNDTPVQGRNNIKDN